MFKHFDFQIYQFSLCHKIYQLDKFEGTDFKHDNIVFKLQPKNTQIRHFWSQIKSFSFFHKILQLGKFEDADFKYDNIVFKLQP